MLSEPADRMASRQEPDRREPLLRRPRSLALGLIATLGDRIREGRLKEGDKLPTEVGLMAEFGVSRTVVREAVTRLQATGLVATRHGVGTFVLGRSQCAGFRIDADRYATLRDVVAVLELRLAVETEAAALAASRRTAANLVAMRQALDACRQGDSAVDADFEFHREVVRATQNPHFADLLTTLGSRIIPRGRLGSSQEMTDEHRDYMRRVDAEHESIYGAIAAQDAEGARAAMRTHLANSRERRRRSQGESSASLR